jgi:hypothetical protein
MRRKAGIGVPGAPTATSGNASCQRHRVSCDDPSCPGWAVFNDDEVQRCDACSRFRHDLAAEKHILNCPSCRALLEKEAAALAVEPAALLRQTLANLS